MVSGEHSHCFWYMLDSEAGNPRFHLRMDVFEPSHSEAAKEQPGPLFSPVQHPGSLRTDAGTEPRRI